MDLHGSLHVLPFLPRLSWVDLACTGDVFAMPLCPLYWSYWLRLWLLSFWTPFSTKVWLGLTICWRRTSERNLSVGSLHALVPCFTRFHQAGLVKLPCAPPTNRHALDLLFHWTTKATRNEFLYRVHGALSLICTFLDWDSHPTGSSLQARPGWLLFKLLCHRQSSLLVTRSFPILALHHFWPHRLSPPRRRLII